MDHTICKRLDSLPVPHIVSYSQVTCYQAHSSMAKQTYLALQKLSAH